MNRRQGLNLAAGAVALFLGAQASAQVNNQWVSFTKDNSHLTVPGTVLTDTNTQVVFRTGDFDKDGWDDVVAVRKSQASQVSPRPNFLLMNVNGVLTDKTAQFATATDVVGDNGFNTSTNDREVAIADVNGDTWLDLVTCVSLSDGKPKNLSHPRVYINLGEDGGGNWLGFRYENARINQLLVAGTGLAVAPRFCGMGLKDVTGDGAPDVYFVDYDGTETGIGEAGNADLNDRLLVNDGNGFFTDQSAARFTVAQLNSSFGADLVIYDLNNDGFNDILKDSTLTNPLVVRALYNNPANVGNFTAMGTSDFGTSAPYGVEVGDLNHDAFKDVVIVDDGPDKYRFGTGFDAFNRMIWGPLKNYSFVSGSENQFGHNPYIRDLNNDGWDDVLITDVDGDLTGCDRRAHIYHNTGTVPGDMNIVIKEEAEQASGSNGAGWKGVVGMSATDLKGSYDFGFGDFDQDGDLDILLATCSGTNYWTNNTNSIPEKCQDDLGNQGPGSMVFSICGQDLTFAGSTATLSVTGAAPGTLLSFVLGLSAGATPFHGGVLVPVPILSIVGGLPANGVGTLSFPIAGGVNTPVHIIMQVIAKPSGFELSNALDLEIGF